MLAALMGKTDISDTLRLAVFAAAFAAVVLLAQLIKAVTSFARINAALQRFPNAPGSNFFLGHVIPLLKAPSSGMGAWDLMESWAKAKGSIVRFRVLGTQGVIVTDPLMLKRVFQTRFKIYAKDLTMSYHPFMPILGTGLVTADGDLWQKQRMLMGPALRIDILDDIVGIAQRCADRLADKLEQHRCGSRQRFRFSKFCIHAGLQLSSSM
jgi:cytochrome P450